MNNERRIRCFWLEPSQLAELSLRRFRYSEGYLKNEDGKPDYSKKDPNYYKCKDGWGCDASVVIGQIPYTRDQGLIDHDRTDPKWPTACTKCGRTFETDDQWQRNEHQLFTRSDNNELVTIRNAPPGAMWDAHWYKDFQGYKKRPDGLMLCLKTPGGDWVIDGPSSNGNGWERSGKPPDVTANPSIICGKYHGWLRNGWLEEC